MISALQDTLAACVAFLPESFLATTAELFRPDLLARLATRLLELESNGPPTSPPEPHFAEEVTPPVGPVFDLFRPVLAEWHAGGRGAGRLKEWASALAVAGVDGALLLLGQRRTPGSLTDARAIPPPAERLLAAANRPCSPGATLSVAGRAWAKHAPRSGEAVWGAVAGGDAAKNASAVRLADAVLTGATWWNVFVHPVHGAVFEARLPSGHGARWGVDDDRFVGFLEPFVDSRRV